MQLNIDGTQYGGWKAIRIQRGIQQIAGQFELSVTDRWAGQERRREIHPGDACTVTIDGETVITGHVDDVLVDYDDQSHGITVTGRDATGDLVDCSAQQIQWKGQTLAAVAARECAPFGIAVRDEAQANTPFKTLKTEPGETVFEALEAAARIRGVLLVSDGRGGLVITRAGTERVPGRLALGVNILKARGTLSDRDRYSDYRVLGQQQGNLWDTADKAYHILGSAADNRIGRHRPLTILAEEAIDQAEAAVRAKWQRNVRAGRSRQVEYTVQGWRTAGGALWQPNRLVGVLDPYTGVDGELLIVSVTCVVDNQGTRTDLALMPRLAFDLIELPEPEEDADAWAE